MAESQHKECNPYRSIVQGELSKGAREIATSGCQAEHYLSKKVFSPTVGPLAGSWGIIRSDLWDMTVSGVVFSRITHRCLMEIDADERGDVKEYEVEDMKLCLLSAPESSPNLGGIIIT
jgi:hypothetical protein